MKRAWWVLVAGLMLAGCAGQLAFGPRECYEFPKYRWDRCPYPVTREQVTLPTIGYDGTRF